MLRYILGNSVGTLTSVLILLCLRYFSGTDDLIVYTELWAFGSLISLVLPFGIDRAILRYNDVQSLRNNEGITLALVSVFCILGLSCSFSETHAAIIMLIGSSRAAIATFVSFTNAYDNSGLYMRIKVLDGSVRLVGLVIIIWGQASLTSYLKYTSMLTLLVVLFLARKDSLVRVKYRIVGRYLKYGLPLAMSASILTGLPHLDRLIGKLSSDVSFIEILSVVGPLITGVYALQAGIYSWYIPKFNKLYAGRRATDSLVGNYLGISILVAVVTVPAIIGYILIFRLSNIAFTSVVFFALSLSFSFILNGYTNVLTSLLMMNNRQWIFSLYSTILGLARIVGFGVVATRFASNFFIVYPIYSLLSLVLYGTLSRNISFCMPKPALTVLRSKATWREYL